MLVAISNGSMSSTRRPPTCRSSRPPATFSVAMSRSIWRCPSVSALVALARLDVDDVRLQRAGVAAEQGVRQRAVAPEEAGQVEPHEQADEGVEEAVAEVRDRQPAPRQQRAVRQRVVEVAGDQQAVAVAGALGDDGRRR